MSYQHIHDPVTNQFHPLDSRGGYTCLVKYLQRGGGKCSGFKREQRLQDSDCPEGCRAVYTKIKKGPNRGKEFWYCNQFVPKPVYDVKIEPMTLRLRKPREPTVPGSQKKEAERRSCRGMTSNEPLTDADCQKRGEHCRAVYQKITRGKKKGTEFWYCNNYRREAKVRYQMTEEERNNRLATEKASHLDRQRQLDQLQDSDSTRERSGQQTRPGSEKKKYKPSTKGNGQGKKGHPKGRR